MIKIRNLGSKGSIRDKYKDNICAELCLKLLFESDWYFCNISESDGFQSDCAETKFLTITFLSQFRQIFLKIAVLKKFAKSVLESANKGVLLRQRCFPVNIAKFLRTAFFIEHLRCFCQFDKVANCSVSGICQATLINQKLNMGWFLLKRFVDLCRGCSSHIVSRNHSNTFLLINMQETKTCSK